MCDVPHIAYAFFQAPPLVRAESGRHGMCAPSYVGMHRSTGGARNRADETVFDNVSFARMGRTIFVFRLQCAVSAPN
jgi:hypothetical protein